MKETAILVAALLMKVVAMIGGLLVVIYIASLVVALVRYFYKSIKDEGTDNN